VLDFDLVSLFASCANIQADPSTTIIKPNNSEPSFGFITHLLFESIDGLIAPCVGWHTVQGRLCDEAGGTRWHAMQRAVPAAD
jgi:hypothetical protein